MPLRGSWHPRHFRISRFFRLSFFSGIAGSPVFFIKCFIFPGFHDFLGFLRTSDISNFQIFLDIMLFPIFMIFRGSSDPWIFQMYCFFEYYDFSGCPGTPPAFSDAPLFLIFMLFPGLLGTTEFIICPFSFEYHDLSEFPCTPVFPDEAYRWNILFSQNASVPQNFSDVPFFFEY